MISVLDWRRVLSWLSLNGWIGVLSTPQMPPLNGFPYTLVHLRGPEPATSLFYRSTTYNDNIWSFQCMFRRGFVFTFFAFLKTSTFTVIFSRQLENQPFAFNYAGRGEREPIRIKYEIMYYTNQTVPNLGLCHNSCTW